MRGLSRGFLAALIGLVLVAPLTAAQAQGGPGLTPFKSDAELRRFLKSVAEGQGRVGGLPLPPPPPVPVAAPPVVAPPSPAIAPSGAPNEIVVTGQRVESKFQDTALPITTITSESLANTQEAITNTQEANVDEGGIVKNRGEMLVVLRRGRLFSVSTAGGKLAALDHIDASAPGVDPGGDWYDEMLLVGDQVVVIGYSYSRGGTEVNRFRLDAAGRFTYLDSHHLRASDYYSAENYASRLIGTKLIFYSGRELYWTGDDPLEVLPAVRRWRGQDDPEKGFSRIVSSSNVFIPPLLRGKRIDLTTLHSVIVCDLAQREMDCEATSVLGSEARVFYVSGTAVYLWVADYDMDGDNARLPPAMVYRLPLDGGRPSAVGVTGLPVDQFSFREDARDRILNVVVRAESGGDRMWRKEVSDGAVALLRIPLADFGNGSKAVPFSRYRDLPSPDEVGDFTNRFVGDYLLYGAGSGWGPRGKGGSAVVAARVRGGEPSLFDLPHPVDRIEIMGPDAVIVGSTDRAMTFSTLELPAAGPKLGARYVLPDAAEAETRSHAFFYRPDPPSGVDGILGLPVARAGNPAYHQLFYNASSMFFLRRQNRQFDPLGELKPATAGFVDDACRASCVDWYGNARPIFLRGRVYALLGYELVEGRVEDGAIREVGRVDFAPRRGR
jgi:hypothetical protein